MNAWTVVTVTVLLVGQALKTEPAQPPPLNDDQLTRLRELIRTTQETGGALQKKLDGLERALAAVYSEYDLDEPRAARLQAAIVDLQRQKLAHYHKMQAELRSIVGKERFDVLKKRLKLIFEPAPARPAEPTPPEPIRPKAK